MSDRGILFLFSILMIVVALAAAAWLLVTGQAGSVDGLFLLLTCLLTAFAFGCYLLYMIHRAMDALQKPAAQTAKSPAAAAQKAAPKPATSTQPVETS
jgi:hypothetical protein